MKPIAKTKGLLKIWFPGMIAIFSLQFFLYNCKDQPKVPSGQTADSSEVLQQQSLPAADETMSDTVRIDIQASFQGGGVEDFQRWVQENIYFPQEAMDYGVSGTVRVRFTISSDGQVTKAEVITTVAPSLDEEALRVIQSSPMWEPAKFEGRNVEQQFTIPVAFVM